MAVKAPDLGATSPVNLSVLSEVGVESPVTSAVTDALELSEALESVVLAPEPFGSFEGSKSEECNLDQLGIQTKPLFPIKKTKTELKQNIL